MNEQQITEAYPIICGWLNGEFVKKIGSQEFWRMPDSLKCFKLITPDFLNDFNQLQWIEDRLRELGYIIATVSDIKGTNVTIYKRDEEPVNAETTSAKSKPIALLQAVMELIEKNAPEPE